MATVTAGLSGLSSMEPGRVHALVRRLLPSGAPLPEDVLAARHRLLYRVLAAHIPVLVALGVSNHHQRALVTVLIPVVLCLAAAVLTPDLSIGAQGSDRATPYLRTGAVAVALGLMACSLGVIVLTGGSTDAHLHLLLMVSFVALYQDGAALVTFFLSAALSLELLAAIDPAILFGHTGASANNPALASGLDLLAMIGIGIALLAFWRETEIHARNAGDLATRIERSALAAAQAEAANRESTSVLLSHLARRNQSLLARQISQLARLDIGSRRADVQELSHLAGRMRRNADSLLVLSGQDARARFGRAEPISTILRRVAASAEVPAQVELLLRLDVTVASRAAADLGHLLEELLDNALVSASLPTAVRPGAPVTIEAGRAVDGRYLIVVVDHGAGMASEAMIAANQRLAEADGSGQVVEELGFRVISRLAQRHGMVVSLSPGQDGGVVALVSLPDALLTALTPAA